MRILTMGMIGAMGALLASCQTAGFGGYDDGTGQLKTACGGACIQQENGMCTKFADSMASTCERFLGNLAVVNQGGQSQSTN